MIRLNDILTIRQNRIQRHMFGRHPWARFTQQIMNIHDHNIQIISNYSEFKYVACNNSLTPKSPIHRWNRVSRHATLYKSIRTVGNRMLWRWCKNVRFLWNKEEKQSDDWLNIQLQLFLSHALMLATHSALLPQFYGTFLLFREISIDLLAVPTPLRPLRYVYACAYFYDCSSPLIRQQLQQSLVTSFAHTHTHTRTHARTHNNQQFADLDNALLFTWHL
jgi:hypothetical protein